MSSESEDTLYMTASNTFNASEKNVLYIWPGEWDLPSLDPECLTIMCYLKYAKLDHKIITVDKSWQLFKNNYPRLEYNNLIYVGIDQILDCLKKQKNVDKMLNDQVYADMLALLNLFKLKFIPAFNALCWLDDENNNTYTVIRRAYGKYLRFPLSLIKLRLMASKIENSIVSNFKTTYIQLDGIKQLLLSDAKECLNTLSIKLSENTFMYENTPTLIDAYLFGYLSILNKAPFSNSGLKAHSIASINLTSLTNRIQKDLFPTLIIDKNKLSINKDNASRIFKWISSIPFFTSSSKTETNSSFKQNEDLEKRKQQLLAIGIGLTAMIFYAFSIGLIKVDIMKYNIEHVKKN